MYHTNANVNNRGNCVKMGGNIWELYVLSALIFNSFLKGNKQMLKMLKSCT